VQRRRRAESDNTIYRCPWAVNPPELSGKRSSRVVRADQATWSRWLVPVDTRGQPSAVQTPGQAGPRHHRRSSGGWSGAGDAQ